MSTAGRPVTVVTGASRGIGTATAVRPVTLGAPHEYVEYVHHAAAKAGVDALTVGLAEELAGGGVRVDAVTPGPSAPASTPTPATPGAWTGSSPASRPAGPATPPPRSPGCSARRPAT